MRGRAVAMANHHCFAFNCTNKKHFGVINGKGQVTISQSEALNTWKYLELANVRFFSIPSGERK